MGVTGIKLYIWRTVEQLMQQMDDDTAAEGKNSLSLDEIMQVFQG